MYPRMKLASTFLLMALLLSFMPTGVTVGHASGVNTCDWAQFVSDVTVPDGTSYAAGATFRKTWRLKNIGTCTWTTSYSLVFDNGEKMGGPASVNLPVTVAPTQTVDISVDLTAPSTAGPYIGYWKFKNATGGLFGIGAAANSSFWVKINVSTGGGTGTGYDFVANAASATWSSGAGTLPLPGTDGDSRGFAITGLHPIFEDNSSPQASILVAPQNITNGYIQGIYPAYKVQIGDRFQAQVGCELQATGCYVQFRLDYQIGSGPVINYWTFREKWEGLTKPAVINLDRLAGQDVKFILVVSAFGSPTGDRALWGNPVITRGGGTAGCTDRALFKKDVTVPDGTSFAPGATFTKTWKIRNIGTCTWTTAYQLIFVSDAQMGGPSTTPLTTTVAPGNEVDLSVALTAPSTAGSYQGNWKLRNNNGADFGLCPFGNCFFGNQKAFWVKINVTGTASNALTLTATANPLTYSQLNQVITYTYVIKNSGTTTLGPAQFTIVDSMITPSTFNCGAANTTLAPNATVTCTANHTITAGDLNAALVESHPGASGGGATSQPATVTITKSATALTLATSASPLTYNQVGQVITFTYVIKNSGTVNLGPAQFTVSDSLINAAPFNCGAANTTLAANATVTCTATYTITAADMTAVSVTNIATASGGGAGPSPSASATVTSNN